MSKKSLFLLALVPAFLFAGCSSNRANINPENSKKNYGKVSIYSNPQRAMILFDGKEIVRTPAIIGRVQKNKSYDVVVKRDGYQDWHETLVLEEGHKTYRLKLLKDGK